MKSSMIKAKRCLFDYDYFPTLVLTKSGYKGLNHFISAKRLPSSYIDVFHLSHYQTNTCKSIKWAVKHENHLLIERRWLIGLINLNYAVTHWLAPAVLYNLTAAASCTLSGALAGD